MDASNITEPAVSDQIPVDECGIAPGEEYNLNMHVLGLFVLLAVSFLGTLLPIICRKRMSKESGMNLMCYFKMFGSGVLLSTAVIHMFTPAVALLTNPCLSETFTSYSGWAGVLTLLGMLCANLLQVGSKKLAKTAEQRGLKAVDDTRMAVYLLEVGIAAHSILIGLSLGVLQGPVYISLTPGIRPAPGCFKFSSIL
jgi:solute carrier family 39 (zinc transporter), member 1/2/3